MDDKQKFHDKYSATIKDLVKDATVNEQLDAATLCINTAFVALFGHTGAKLEDDAFEQQLRSINDRVKAVRNASRNVNEVLQELAAALGLSEGMRDKLDSAKPSRPEEMGDIYTEHLQDMFDFAMNSGSTDELLVAVSNAYSGMAASTIAKHPEVNREKQIDRWREVWEKKLREALDEVDDHLKECSQCKQEGAKHVQFH